MDSLYSYVSLCASLITLVCLVVRFCFPHAKYEIPAHDIRKGHHWCLVDTFPQPAYCCISGEHIIQGLHCDYCGVCVNSKEIKKANKTLRCKAVTNFEETLTHHWIRGNLPLCSTCGVCDEACGVLPRLCDLRCCWCQMTVHDLCVFKVGRVCDLGTNKKMIVPPNCVRIREVGVKRHHIVSHVQYPAINQWRPLIVIANKKSGNNDGEHLLQIFRSLLNPVQVIDIHSVPPECAIEWCHLLPDTSWRILVCGGDGTIGWVLNAIDKLKLKTHPEVSILPLGTGNDLSRTLGWGPGYTGDVDVNNILTRIRMYSKPVNLDRWKIDILSPKHFGLSQRKKSVVMTSYVSIGVDALVCLNFHRHRQTRPRLFSSRIFNKFWYFHYGTKDVLERECKNLHKNVTLDLDGRRQELPEIEGLVVLNIASWGGGCRPWSLLADDAVPESRYDDGLLEVMGIYSSFHMAQMQVGLAEPLRFGQARRVKITIGGTVPMQMDGEPWEQKAAEVTVTHHNTAKMLCTEYGEYDF